MSDSKPTASLSLDLDNLWSYLKTHGDPIWQEYPSYLDLVVPRLLDFFANRNQLLTFFIVGRDASVPDNRGLLRQITASGHEIGNHSFSHEPWFHLYSKDRIEEEISATEQAIEDSTGLRPLGFRGPGYSLSKPTLEVLAERGYRYDGSTLPTYLGPLSRWYYFRTSNLDQEQKRERARLFGSFREGLRPLQTYRWHCEGLAGVTAGVIEIPVTTAPLIRTPIHCSYLLYLSRFSPALSRAYLRTALSGCRAFGVEPSLLLHPLDFLGREDVASLSFFPAMELPAETKLRRMTEYLDILNRYFEVVTMATHAERASQRDLPVVEPDFPATEPAVTDTPNPDVKHEQRTPGAAPQDGPAV